jgi:hypothetical protein
MKSTLNLCALSVLMMLGRGQGDRGSTVNKA